MYDVVIIGAGSTGAFIARELSKYKINVLVIEKNNDVGFETSMANSAIIHSGYDPKPGTLKAKLNVRGNSLYDEICKDLDVEFKRIGSLTLAFNDEQISILQQLKERAKANDVKVKIIDDKEEIIKLEPNINRNVKAVLFAESAGIIDPFNLVVHAFENACDNGVKLVLNEEVKSIIIKDNIYHISTNKQLYTTKIVINAAGLYADNIANMIEQIDFNIVPRKGQYYILDHFKDGYINHVLFPLPSEKGKGVLVSPTTSGNYIIGPSSELVSLKDDISTDSLTLKHIKENALLLVDNIPMNESIRVFAGLRATPSTHDFFINHSKKYKTFINVAGIESPGLASAPAIGEYVVNELVKPILPLEKKLNFNPKVRKYIKTSKLTSKELEELIKKDSSYGKIICSCEKVSLGELLDCLNRSVPPRSIKSVKKRIRMGFGKCQGGFCQPQVLLTLKKFYHLDMLDIVYDNENSEILLKKIKEKINEN